MALSNSARFENVVAVDRGIKGIGQNAMLIASSIAAGQAISQKSIVPSCE